MEDVRFTKVSGGGICSRILIELQPKNKNKNKKKLQYTLRRMSFRLYLWVARFDDEAGALLLNLLELEASAEPSCILLLNALAMTLSSALSSCRSNSSLYI